MEAPYCSFISQPLTAPQKLHAYVGFPFTASDRNVTQMGLSIKRSLLSSSELWFQEQLTSWWVWLSLASFSGGSFPARTVTAPASSRPTSYQLCNLSGPRRIPQRTSTGSATATCLLNVLLAERMWGFAWPSLAHMPTLKSGHRFDPTKPMWAKRGKGTTPRGA